MTIRSVTYLKGRFENNDVPTATDYEDVFDSFLNFSTSADQSFDGRIYAPELNAALVSATTGNFPTLTGTSISGTVVAGATVSAGTSYADTSKINVVSANSIYVNSGLFLDVATSVNCLATTQTSSITLSNSINFLAFADGTNNAVRLPASNAGRVQYIINSTNTIVKVFPAVSALFVVTAVNAPLSIGVNTRMIVVHKGDDRYASIVGV